MLRRTLLLLAPAASLAILAGCMPVDPGFGETHRWNIEQQVVDPDPEYAGEIIEGGSGQRAVAAVDRYNRGQVKQPVRTNAAGGEAAVRAEEPRAAVGHQ